MAIGKASDFKIYQEEFFGGMSEVIEQNANGFNENAGGCIVLTPERLVGDYEKESYFKLIADLVSRRDTTSVAAATDLAMTQDEFIGVKLNRKIGPVAQTLDALKKIGKDEQEISFVLGQQTGQAVMVEMLNTILEALNASIGAVSALNYDATADTLKTANHTALVGTLAKMGDMASNVKLWVMHSQTYYALMKQALADKIFEVAGVVIYDGNVATFNRPVLVTDSDALFDDNGSAADTYNVLGLVPGAGIIKESEDKTITAQLITGLENLVVRIQGEYAYNVSVKGCKWDIANGGANPSAAAVATGTNWDKVVTSHKSMAGVRCKFNAV